ncbi:MAG: type II secretion system protein [Burkholderiales bacterium]|nr:type II secretion system protein [Burkholderiales bacterium]
MHSTRSRGISLVELVVFIAIISTALAGILGVMSFTTRASADPLAQKQALAIAEAYLEEVLAMPFTYCDPDDANAATAQSTAAVNPADPARCATTLEGIGAEGETRGSATTPYDNVNDYASLPAGVPANVDGTPIGGLEAYTVSVAVNAAALAASSGTVAATDSNGRPLSLRVTVTVNGPNGVTVVLDGYRTRYAPNALP